MRNNTQTIFLPIFGLCMILLFIGLIFWKKFCHYHRTIIPYTHNPQVTFITSTYQQQQVRPYQPNWPLPLVEQPPSYYTVMNYQMIPPTMSYVKQ